MYLLTILYASKFYKLLNGTWFRFKSLVKGITPSVYLIRAFSQYAQVAQSVEQRTENPCVGAERGPVDSAPGHHFKH